MREHALILLILLLAVLPIASAFPDDQTGSLMLVFHFNAGGPDVGGLDEIAFDSEGMIRSIKGYSNVEGYENLRTADKDKLQLVEFVEVEKAGRTISKYVSDYQKKTTHQLELGIQVVDESTLRVTKTTDSEIRTVKMVGKYGDIEYYYKNRIAFTLRHGQTVSTLGYPQIPSTIEYFFGPSGLLEGIRETSKGKPKSTTEVIFDGKHKYVLEKSPAGEHYPYARFEVNMPYIRFSPLSAAVNNLLFPGSSWFDLIPFITRTIVPAG